MKDIVDFVLRDDTLIVAEQQLAEAKKQTELLQTIKDQTTPVENNWMNVLHLDLSVTHDSYEIWKWYEGHPNVNSVVIPMQEIDYYYEIEPGKKVLTEAGLITDLSGHDIKLLRISHSETSASIMDIIFAGVKS